jgi:hypothetical protein
MSIIERISSSKRYMSTLEPPVGRDAYLDELSSSDLSVEELLASGADVGDLVSAGVLYDDYDPDNDPDYFFTPLRPVEEFTPGPPMSDEEFKVWMNKSFRFFNLAEEFKKESARLRAKGITVGSPEFTAFAEEFKEKAARLRAEKLAENASNNPV